MTSLRSVEENEVETQTDAFLDRPPSPLFVPVKSGIDIATQIENGEVRDENDTELKTKDFHNYKSSLLSLFLLLLLLLLLSSLLLFSPSIPSSLFISLLFLFSCLTLTLK